MDVASAEDSFQLYDLRVVVEAPEGAKLLCSSKVGDYFTLEGEVLRFPPGQGWSLYSLAAVMPLLSAKQRLTAPNDWMSTDAVVACPDPLCKSTMRIVRTGLRTFRHSDVTATSLDVPEHDVQAGKETVPKA